MAATKQMDFPSLPEIKSKLPKECFRSELGTSLYYVARSVVFVLALFAGAYFLLDPASPYFLQSEPTRVC